MLISIGSDFISIGSDFFALVVFEVIALYNVVKVRIISLFRFPFAVIPAHIHDYGS